MNQQAITVFARWRVKEGQLDTVLSLVAEAARTSAAEEGNLAYQVHQSTTDPNTLILFEVYKNEAALNTHRQSGHFQRIVVGQIVPLLDDREVTLSTRVI